MFKKVAPVLLAAVAVLGVVVAMRPPTYQVTRSTQVMAAPAIAFAQVNDFHKWNTWSPWAKRDTSMQTIYSGPDRGVGATYDWTGNSKVGAGCMTITGSRPPEEVVIKLEFLKPFQSDCVTTFTFVPDGPSTRVTWTMTGTNNYVAKALSLFANMDKMIGQDFESGLAALKVQAESANLQHAAEVAAAHAGTMAPPAGAPAPASTPAAPVAQ